VSDGGFSSTMRLQDAATLYPLVCLEHHASTLAKGHAILFPTLLVTEVAGDFMVGPRRLVVSALTVAGRQVSP
jgi:hypothetical protein